MSSETPYETQKGWAASAQAMDARMLNAGKQLGLTERQRRLNQLWARYRCLQYDGRSVAWDGTKAYEPEEIEQVATAGFLPPGFIDPGGASLPVRFRRPSSPYHLFRVIVDRFTSLLFNERRHPQLRIEDDEDTEAFVRALWDTARGWAAMMRARAYGGAQGTVAVGFQFVKGRPVIEVHDPRWLFPEFADRFSLTLRRVEKRLQYPQEVKREDGKGWETKFFWYRRVLDEVSDTTFLPEEVTEQEPEWREDPGAIFQHGLGFCPVVWVQNLPVDDDIDGAPDCEGILDVLDSLDQTLSQTHKGTNANADPTLCISADGDMGREIQTGSDNAIKMPKDGQAKYLEIAGTSIEAGLKLATELRRIALEVAQCVLEAGADRTQPATATEVQRTYSSMLAKGGMLREQYGVKLVVPLIQMMLKAVRLLGGPRAQNGGIQRGGIFLSGWKGQRVAGGLAQVPNLPDQPDVQLQWPDFFDPSLADVELAARAAALAKAGRLVDAEHATKFVASYFHAEDADKMLGQIQKEAASEDLAAASIGQLNAASGQGSAVPAEGGGKGGTPAPPGGFIRGTTTPARGAA